ncbi:hypothetical protein LCGC14_1756450, partial [marine sediment metagenome]
TLSCILLVVVANTYPLSIFLKEITMETLGLVKLRRQTAKKPKHFCSNCNMHRYYPCYCRKGKGKKKKTETPKAKE